MCRVNTCVLCELFKLTHSSVIPLMTPWLEHQMSGVSLVNMISTLMGVPMVFAAKVNDKYSGRGAVDDWHMPISTDFHSVQGWHVMVCWCIFPDSTTWTFILMVDIWFDPIIHPFLKFNDSYQTTSQFKASHRKSQLQSLIHVPISINCVGIFCSSW